MAEAGPRDHAAIEQAARGAGRGHSGLLPSDWRFTCNFEPSLRCRALDLPIAARAMNRALEVVADDR